MNLILLIPLITSLLHSISSQSSESSSNKGKKKYNSANKYVTDVGTSEDDPKIIPDSPSSNVTEIEKKSIIPINVNKIPLHDKHLEEYQSRVVEELKEELRKHNRMPCNFTFSPYLSMSAALYRINSEHFAKFLANKVLEGFQDADQIGRDVKIDGRITMKLVRRTSYKVKDHYEKPSGSGTQGRVFPQHNLAYGESLSDLGMSEYDAEGHLVKEAEPKSLFNLDNIGEYHKYLQQYEENVLKELKEELQKNRMKVKYHEPSPYLSMAAAFYGISSRRFAQFLADNVIHQKITDLNRIANRVFVVEHVRMVHLRKVADKIRRRYEGEGGAGPSSSGSHGGI